MCTIFFNKYLITESIQQFLIENQLYSNNASYYNWILYSNIFNIILISFFIILLGILFPNKAKTVKFLNLISAFYLLIFFYLTTSEYIYNAEVFNKIVLNSFHQNYNLYVNFFFFIATITVFLFFLSISDIFYLEENMKIEYTLLVFYVYIGALLLITSLDFISIIILLECIAFSSYVLVGFERKNKFSTSAALKYLILASIPSGFFILGISILYNNYGSFYQDYLEILLNSFDKFNLTSLDWFYISNYYHPQFDLNIEKFLYNNFYAYLCNLEAFLTIYNPFLMIFLFDVESYLRTFTLDSLKYVNDVPTQDGIYIMQNNIDAIKNEFEEEYIILYLSYLYVLKALIDLNNLWDFFYYVSSEGKYAISTTHEREVVDFIYIYLYEHNFTNILNWMHYYSYHLYAFENAKTRLTADTLLGFFNIKTIQNANINYLTETSFIPYFNTFSWNGLISLSLELETSGKIFLENFLRYMSFNPKTIEVNKIILNNAFMGEISKFLEERSFTKNWEDFTYETTIGFCNYNNIFLTTYLVIIFILINLSFKITAAPFHFWAPSVYGASPLPTITFLSVFSKLTIIFLMINLFLTIFDNLKFIWQPIFFFLGVFSVIISILGAFSEKMFKRFFVYSSIGHVGFMILGIATLNYEGIQGTIDYLILYIISSFIVWFIVMHLTKKTTHLISFKGFSNNYPILSLILVISLFSISGLPPMGGFFVKFEIFYSLLNSSQYFIAYFLFILTVFSFFYYLRLIKIIYFEDNKTIKKIKNSDDIKLRVISILIFILPLYVLLMQEPFFYILKESIITSLK